MPNKRQADFLRWLHNHLKGRHNPQLGWMVQLSELATTLETSLHPLLTPEEVAYRYGVSLKRLKNWRENRSGGPAWIKIGQNAVRYRREDLETWELTRLMPGIKTQEAAE